MAIIEHDWVWETATVSGTGSVTLPGTPAQTGAQLLPIAQAPALDWSHPFEPTFTTSTSAPEPYIYGPFIGK